ncbi:MAG: acyl--CoA ligase [Proteobacteria bacterium]|nr:acyl--CoA ligase [Pseudomonadota bacterium]
MSFVALSRLLALGRPAAHPVAFRNGAIADFATFRNDVAVAAGHLQGCRRAALICDDSYAFAVGMFGLLHAGARVVLPSNGHPGTLAALAGSFERVVGDAILAPGTPAELRPLDPDGARFDFYTSGSTGTPKHVEKDLRRVEAELAALDGLLGTLPDAGPAMATVPHHHVYGLTFKVLLPLATGRPFRAEMQEFWESVLPALTATTMLVTSPAHLARLDGLPAVAAGARPAIVLSAGAPLSLAAARDCERLLGSLPFEIFGTTETGAIATRRQSAEDAPWRPMPGVEIRLDANACLQVRSGHVGPQWVATSDRVELHAGGFRFLERADRVVKIEGKRVSLAEVEQALLALPAVAAAAATLLPGSPERLAAAIVPSRQGAAQLQTVGAFRFGRQLRTALAESQEPACLPKHWRFVEALPLQAMGKRRDADVRALFGDRA